MGEFEEGAGGPSVDLKMWGEGERVGEFICSGRS